MSNIAKWQLEDEAKHFIHAWRKHGFCDASIRGMYLARESTLSLTQFNNLLKVASTIGETYDWKNKPTSKHEMEHGGSISFG